MSAPVPAKRHRSTGPARVLVRILVATDDAARAEGARRWAAWAERAIARARRQGVAS